MQRADRNTPYTGVVLMHSNNSLRIMLFIARLHWSSRILIWRMWRWSNPPTNLICMLSVYSYRMTDRYKEDNSIQLHAMRHVMLQFNDVVWTNFVSIVFFNSHSQASWWSKFYFGTRFIRPLCACNTDCVSNCRLMWIAYLSPLFYSQCMQYICYALPLIETETLNAK